MEPSRTPLAAGGRQGRLQPPPPPKPPPRIKSALRPQPARPRRAATSGGGRSGGRLRVEGRGGFDRDGGGREKGTNPGTCSAGCRGGPAARPSRSALPPPPPNPPFPGGGGGVGGGWRLSPLPGPPEVAAAVAAWGGGGDGPGGPCCAAARPGSGGGGWKRRGLLRCSAGKRRRRRRLPGGFYRAGSGRRGFRGRRRPDAGLRTPPPQRPQGISGRCPPSLHPSIPPRHAPASPHPSLHRPITPIRPSLPLPPSQPPGPQLTSPRAARRGGGGSVSASSQPRAPQLRFAPEGKCSPEPPADLKPALGRGSSRSHPSLARSPSGQERATPGAGRWLRGERGSAGRPGPPPLPRPPLPEHPRFAFCRKCLPSPEPCSWVSQGTDHPLPPKPLPGGALPPPRGPVKLSPIS